MIKIGDSSTIRPIMNSGGSIIPPRIPQIRASIKSDPSFFSYKKTRIPVITQITTEIVIAMLMLVPL